MDTALTVGIGERFKSALHRLESGADPNEMVSLFAPQGAIITPAKPHPMVGTERIRAFWQDYQGAFASVQTDFIRTIECGSDICLEWISRVTPRMAQGVVEYAGVTLLSTEGEIVREMRSYFDPRPLLAI